MKPIYRENWWSSSDKHPPEAKRYYYFRMFIKEGSDVSTKQLGYIWCLHDRVFFRLLNEWNAFKSDVWKYWSELT